MAAIDDGVIPPFELIVCCDRRIFTVGVDTSGASSVVVVDKDVSREKSRPLEANRCRARSAEEPSDFSFSLEMIRMSF